jgi:nitrite/sulfite reductase ferredoxin-like protein/tetrapyrrole (corrin/porphyrin) methylase-like protein
VVAGIDRTVTRRPVEKAPPTLELVLKRNSVERIKREKDPLGMLGELPALIAAGYERVPEEDLVRLKWWGLYHDKPKIGTFMLRIKLPAGRVTPAQLEAIGELSSQYGKGSGELSTRQTIQLHYLELASLPEVFRRLDEVGLTTVDHRGISDHVTIASCQGADGGDADYARLAAMGGTLVLFMGLGRVERVVDGMLAAGMQPETPVAAISRGTLPDQEVVRTTLQQLAGAASGLAGPALIVVGDVAALDVASDLQTERLGGAEVAEPERAARHRALAAEPA